MKTTTSITTLQLWTILRNTNHSRQIRIYCPIATRHRPRFTTTSCSLCQRPIKRHRLWTSPSEEATLWWLHPSMLIKKLGVATALQTTTGTCWITISRCTINTRIRCRIQGTINTHRQSRWYHTGLPLYPLLMVLIGRVRERHLCVRVSLLAKMGDMDTLSRCTPLIHILYRYKWLMIPFSNTKWWCIDVL